MEARWETVSGFLAMGLVNKLVNEFGQRIRTNLLLCCFFLPHFHSWFINLVFVLKQPYQWETFGEAGQKPELGSREATAVAAVAPTSPTSNRTILPNIDITKLGFHLFFRTNLFRLLKIKPASHDLPQWLWVSVDSIDPFSSPSSLCSVTNVFGRNFYRLFRSCFPTKARINSGGWTDVPTNAVTLSQRVWPQL